ncbi:hypothetical protein PAXRUDRAFT_339293 [Paxillus rubicundulus Ve08.2h10]|uniref:Uncharacterized protein n=1 Tax=Paxillus rubicundulus Ve08.2h10 TaxID=930991 RepID=A0A0D0C4W9_9AGAM|nr:hypothetical protein PAXRUDRAFT_339293 [Paxillus rubicundulus Ve08.2h10]
MTACKTTSHVPMARTCPRGPNASPAMSAPLHTRSYTEGGTFLQLPGALPMPLQSYTNSRPYRHFFNFLFYSTFVVDM